MSSRRSGRAASSPLSLPRACEHLRELSSPRRDTCRENDAAVRLRRFGSGVFRAAPSCAPPPHRISAEGCEVRGVRRSGGRHAAYSGSRCVRGRAAFAPLTRPGGKHRRRSRRQRGRERWASAWGAWLAVILQCSRVILSDFIRLSTCPISLSLSLSLSLSFSISISLSISLFNSLFLVLSLSRRSGTGCRGRRGPRGRRSARKSRVSIRRIQIVDSYTGGRMASSPTSIENQIDSFLEQFKRSASRAMEETAAHHQRSGSYNACSSSISRSRSGNLDLELLEAGKFWTVRSGRPGNRIGKSGSKTRHADLLTSLRSEARPGIAISFLSLDNLQCKQEWKVPILYFS